jgi:hypothetical protein
MKAKFSVKHLLFRTLIVAVILFGLWLLFDWLPVYPSGEGNSGLDPNSFRYRLGLWFEGGGAMMLLILICWPAFFAGALGFRSGWLIYPGFIVAGLSWVLLWDFGRRLIRDCLCPRDERVGGGSPHASQDEIH